jgi:hypothetical protein
MNFRDHRVNDQRSHLELVGALSQPTIGQIDHTIEPTTSRDFEIYRAKETQTVRPIGSTAPRRPSIGVCHRVDVIFFQPTVGLIIFFCHSRPDTMAYYNRHIGPIYAQRELRIEQMVYYLNFTIDPLIYPLFLWIQLKFLLKYLNYRSNIKFSATLGQ